MAYIGLNRIFTKNREKSKNFKKIFRDSESARRAESESVKKLFFLKTHFGRFKTEHPNYKPTAGIKSMPNYLTRFLFNRKNA